MLKVEQIEIEYKKLISSKSVRIFIEGERSPIRFLFIKNGSSYETIISHEKIRVLEGVGEMLEWRFGFRWWTTKDSSSLLSKSSKDNSAEALSAIMSEEWVEEVIFDDSTVVTPDHMKELQEISDAFSGRKKPEEDLKKTPTKRSAKINTTRS